MKFGHYLPFWIVILYMALLKIEVYDKPLRIISFLCLGIIKSVLFQSTAQDQPPNHSIHTYCNCDIHRSRYTYARQLFEATIVEMYIHICYMNDIFLWQKVEFQRGYNYYFHDNNFGRSSRVKTRPWHVCATWSAYACRSWLLCMCAGGLTSGCPINEWNMVISMREREKRWDRRAMAWLIRDIMIMFWFCCVSTATT